MDKWSLFLRYAPDPKHRKKVNEVIESEEVLSVAGELLMHISQDERERAIFRSRKKYQTDYQSDMATAWDNGVREGQARQSIEIARNLLKMGLPLDQIAAATGLTYADIGNL